MIYAAAMFAARTSWNLQPNRFTAALQQARADGIQLIDLTESNPTHIGLEYEPWILEPLASLAVLEYRPDPKGMEPARQAVHNYYRERGGTEAPPPLDRIILTSGSSEAYSFVFRLLCDTGDEVLVPAPSYPLFEFLASVQDVRLRSYPLIYDHGWQLDLHSLSAAITPKTRAVVVVHPNNPTGSFVKPDEMKALGELCREHGLALVADEVFLDYAHDRRPHASFIGADTALTFTVSGLSKICALPQMKLGWIVVNGPGELMRNALERLEIIADTYLSVSTPVQLAAREFITTRQDTQAQIHERLMENRAELDRQLAAHSSCRRLEIEGGWYAVLRVPVTGSDEDLAIKLLQEHGVLVHPGHFYDFPQDGYLVVSLIPPGEAFAEGIARLLKGI
jgi:alanine-synthesizing transaminase